MKRFRFAAMVAATLSVFSLSATNAYAQDDIRGRWSGYGSTVSGGPARFVLDVIAQRGGVFRGAVMIESDPGPTQFPVTGFELGDGTIVAAGRDAAGDTLSMLGRQRPFGDGAVHVASMAYIMFGPRGALIERGYTAFVQMQLAMNWKNPGPTQLPAVQGQWLGDFASTMGGLRGNMQMDLVQVLNETGGPTTALAGSGRVATQPGPIGIFDLQGTVGLPAVQADGGLSAPFAVVWNDPTQSPGEPAVLLLVGTWINPGPTQLPAVQGQYRAYASFFDVFAEVALGRGSAMDAGVFRLPAVQ